MIGGVLASLLVLAATWNVASPDWTDCPTPCQCKWSSGKKSAFCRDAGFTTLPVLNADIQVLDLTRNLIPHLSKDAFKSVGLLNLQRIFLRNTSLREIHPDAFRNLSILVEIDLSENNISKIHPDTFSGNERLRFLNLSGNPLTELMSSQFPSLKYLKTIELQHCDLTSVHSEAFVNLPLLETLNMNSNRLKNISKNAFKIIKKLKTLKLDNNPWRCDCGLRDFRDWLLLSNLYSVPLTCSEPSDLAGLRWNEVPTREFACSPTATLTDLIVQEDRRSPQIFRKTGIFPGVHLADVVNAQDGRPFDRVPFLGREVLGVFTSGAFAVFVFLVVLFLFQMKENLIRDVHWLSVVQPKHLRFRVPGYATPKRCSRKSCRRLL